jgi:Flp pilus assembly protein TadG
MTNRQKSGSALVEFALVSLPLALLLCGICQYGFIYAANMTVRNATVVAARYATLVTTATVPNSNQITVVALDALGPMIVPTNNNVRVNVDPNVTVGGAGGAVSVQIQYDLPLIIPWVVPGKSAGDSLTLTATTIMR